MRSRAAEPSRVGHDTLIAVTAISLAALLAYHGSFAVPFFFDDAKAIVENASIRHLGRITDVLFPPAGGSGIAGRPIVNLSLAINYAVGGLDPRGYHAVNLAFHIGSALALFGIVRRTFLLPSLRPEFEVAAFPLALAVALVWVVHPLHTESVTCVVQRTELVVGLFFLTTLYSFVRSVSELAPGRWPIISVVTGALGMASKEVMVSAPLLVFLYDRTFVAGSFRNAWQIRRRYYLQLAATWLVLAGLLLGMGGSRGSAAGLGLGVPWWAYALKQCEAIPTYFKLSFWPQPLVLDYGTDLVFNPLPVLGPGLVLLTLVILTFAALRWRPMIGFPAFWVFAILAPSSSVIPLISQTMAEHRMYLPLAAIVVLAFVAAHRWIGLRITLIAALLSVGGIGVSVARNRMMQDEFTIWSDTLGKRPTNARAHASYALALANRGRRSEALRYFTKSLELDPLSAVTEQNYGTTCFEFGDFPQAAVHLQRAVSLDPNFVSAHTNLGATLLELGDPTAALACHQRALALDPNHILAQRNAGRALFALGRFAESAQHYAEVVRQSPNSADAHYDLGLALARSGDMGGAMPRFTEAMHLKPDPVAHLNYARFLAGAGYIAEARASLETALRLKPDFPEARSELERLR